MKRLSPLAYNLYRFTPDTELREQRKFWKLYCVALLVMGLVALVIWKAESNHREEIKRSSRPVSVDSRAHYGARVTGEKAGQPVLEL